MDVKTDFESALQSNPRLAHEYFIKEAPVVWSAFPVGVCDSARMKDSGWEGPFGYKVDGESFEVYGKSALCEISMRGFLAKIASSKSSGTSIEHPQTDATPKRTFEVGSGLGQDGKLPSLSQKEREGVACRRWLARMVDASIVSVLYYLVCAFLIHCHIITHSGGILGQIIFLPFYFLFDAFLLFVLKTTFGRALLRLGLERQDGESLTLRDCLSRNFRVWMCGMWFGALAPIGMLIQYNKVKKCGEASYESKCSAHVFALTCSRLRIIMSVLLLLFVWSGHEYIIRAVFPDIVIVGD